VVAGIDGDRLIVIKEGEAGEILLFAMSARREAGAFGKRAEKR